MIIQAHIQTAEMYVDWAKVYNVAPNAAHSISQNNLIVDVYT